MPKLITLAGATLVGAGLLALLPAPARGDASRHTVLPALSIVTRRPSCAVTPVHTTPFHRRDLAVIPWIEATPASAGITGHLFYRRPGARGTAADMPTGGTMPDGASTKILWLVENPKAQGPLVIDGRNLAGRGTIHQTFPGSTEVPSIVDLPTPGCWRLQVRSGPVAGTVTMLAVT